MLRQGLSNSKVEVRAKSSYIRLPVDVSVSKRSVLKFPSDQIRKVTHSRAGIRILSLRAEIRHISLRYVGTRR